MQTNHEFITSTEKTLCQVHHVPEQARGDLQLCSHTKESRVKNLIPTETVIPLAHQVVQEENEALSRLSESEKDTRFILEGQRDKLLQDVKSEVLKQECKGEMADGAILELQRQTDKLIPIVWKLTILTLDRKRLEESKPGIMKNWRNKKEHFEKLI